MKYAKPIVIVAAMLSVGLWFDGAAGQPAGATDDPVTIAHEATGLTFQANVEKIRGGEINWARGTVCAVGTGKAREDLSGRRAELMAKRGAYIVAARNAALVLAGVRVGPGGRFENVRNGWIRADVTLKGFRELDATYDPATRTATARMEIPICGVRGAVSVLGLEGQKARRFWTWPKPPTGAEYDVIVIDARGLACRPSVLTRISTADGQCVFDTAEVLAGDLPRRLSARYVTLPRNMKIPPQSDHRRRRCLGIRAVRVDADGAIVLDQANLNVLSQAPDAQQTLRRGKLLIVTDG
ncbi:MAG: hypothetical protein JW849_07670 [Phycisphaerae bacterium]|nr:hypothetical protein [Phycisphaerae bacterium]